MINTDCVVVKYRGWIQLRFQVWFEVEYQVCNQVLSQLHDQLYYKDWEVVYKIRQKVWYD